MSVSIEMNSILVVLLAIQLAGWEVSAGCQLGTELCSNLAYSGERPGADQFFGTWYAYASNPLLLDTKSKCLTGKVYSSNGSIFFDRYWISTM